MRSRRARPAKRRELIHQLQDGRTPRVQEQGDRPAAGHTSLAHETVAQPATGQRVGEQPGRRHRCGASRLPRTRRIPARGRGLNERRGERERGSSASSRQSGMSTAGSPQRCDTISATVIVVELPAAANLGQESLTGRSMAESHHRAAEAGILRTPWSREDGLDCVVGPARPSP